MFTARDMLTGLGKPNTGGVITAAAVVVPVGKPLDAWLAAQSLKPSSLLEASEFRGGSLL
jgi:hypothetical protein